MAKRRVDYSRFSSSALLRLLSRLLASEPVREKRKDLTFILGKHAMKNLFFISLCALFLCAGVSAAPPLAGKWQSSRDLSMAFIENNVRLEAKTESFLRQLTGYTTLDFDAEHVTLDLPDITVKIDEKDYPMQGFREKNRYKVLFTDDTRIVIQVKEPFSSREMVTIYHFVDDDTMWIYLGDSSPGLPDLHIREYFVRVK
jgi:hypothetical protein